MKDSYQILAPYYNEVMEHVDYIKWNQFLDRILKNISFEPKRILELASGTGQFKETFKRPFEYYVKTDLSIEMIKQGKVKGDHCAAMDMQHIAAKSSSFDFIFCLYDSFNYLLDDEAVESCLSEIYRALEPGGYFLFDVISEQMCLDFFDDYLDFQQANDGSHIYRQSNYDLQNRIQQNKFTYFIPQSNDLFKKQIDRHEQKIWWLSELEAFIAKSNLILVKLMGDFTLKQGDENSLRLNFLLQKPL